MKGRILQVQNAKEFSEWLSPPHLYGICLLYTSPTFYLADKILVISDSKEPEYLEGEGAEQILAAYTDNMIARGYACLLYTSRCV